jgi:Na+-transporting methylmalonyl-CoA/oxaloacetate decarboxylase beta subunit
MASILTGTDLAAQEVLDKGPESGSALLRGLQTFWHYTGFANVTIGNITMIAVGLFFIFLAIRYDYEPLLLIPIGSGILLGNIPFQEGFQIGIYEDGSVLN